MHLMVHPPFLACSGGHVETHVSQRFIRLFGCKIFRISIFRSGIARAPDGARGLSALQRHTIVSHMWKRVSSGGWHAPPDLSRPRRRQNAGVVTGYAPLRSARLHKKPSSPCYSNTMGLPILPLQENAALTSISDVQNKTLEHVCCREQSRSRLTPQGGIC